MTRIREVSQAVLALASQYSPSLRGGDIERWLAKLKEISAELVNIKEDFSPVNFQAALRRQSEYVDGNYSRCAWANIET